jgi:hypothetical protein
MTALVFPTAFPISPPGAEIAHKQPPLQGLELLCLQKERLPWFTHQGNGCGLQQGKFSPASDAQGTGLPKRLSLFEREAETLERGLNLAQQAYSNAVDKIQPREKRSSHASKMGLIRPDF